MKLQYCLTGILCLFLKSDAQQIKPLSIGDKVPAIVIKNIYNYPALQSSLSAFKNKLVILDFMGTTCSSCIRALPHFDSLQKLYDDKLQIILVSYEKREKIKKFLTTGKALQLPIVAEDSILGKLFPHIYIPHQVWINNGIVKAITGTRYVNSENIQAVLAGKFINWPVKHDIKGFDYSKPVLKNAVPAFYSVVARNIKDVPAKYVAVTDTAKQTVRIAMFNLGIVDLYLRTYGLYTFPQAYTILRVKNIDRYVYDKNKFYRDAWKLANTYCYEAVLPAGFDAKQQGNKMRSDLDAWLALHGRMEKRTIPCNIITKMAAVEHNGNTPMSSLIYILNQNIYGSPFIDETNYKGKFSMDRSILTLHDIDAIKNFLQPYGLQIKTELREVEVFVISEQ